MNTTALALNKLRRKNTFTTVWKTDNAGGVSSNTQVRLPLENGGTYNFVVGWGDGKYDRITVYNQAEITHTYAVAGTYIVTIDGVCRGWRFANAGDKTKLLEIRNWGLGFRLGNNNGYFYGCTNLVIKAKDKLDLTGTAIWQSAFRSCTSLERIPSMDIRGNWDMSKATNVYIMFLSATAFNQPVSYWDTANITNMNSLFTGCSAFNQPVSNFNTAKVTDMVSMFGTCTVFNQSVSNFNTAACTLMRNMFNQCAAFNQSVSNFNTANVTDMNSMFVGCTVFNQPVSNFNTAKVTDMQLMFANAFAFNQSVSNFDTSKVTNFYMMFGAAAAFKQSLSTFNVTAATNLAYMLNGVDINDAGTTTRYDALLIAWAAQGVKPSQSFDGGTSKYSAGAAATARGVLTGTKSWTIVDGNQAA